MTKIDLSLSLPASLARDAEAAGLLSPRAFQRMLRDEVRRAAARRISKGAARVRAAEVTPMSLTEIQDIVEEVRKDA